MAIFTAERFAVHELANHAAAGAYAFLLSATPAVLLVLGLASALIGRFPRAFAGVRAVTLDLLGPLASPHAIGNFFDSRLGLPAMAFGVVSLVWASRLFIVAVQRGIRLIYSASGRNTLIKDNVLTFAVELLCLVAMVIVLTLPQGLRLLIEMEAKGSRSLVTTAMRAAMGAAPVLALFIFVFLTYLTIPPERPRRKSVLISALLCLVVYGAFAEMLGLLMDSTHYHVLYGVFGRLIILLIKVYTFFTLYFYGAELTYVIDHFDALLFARFWRVARTPAAGRLERALFVEPAHLLRSYARSYPAGSTIFEAGEPGKTVFYVYDGEVGVFLGRGKAERRLSDLGPGEVFGEMAYILDEPRTATARAIRDSVLLEMPPGMFDLYLRSDAEAMRRLTDSMSSRLRQANIKLAENDERTRAGSKGKADDDGDGDCGPAGDDLI